MNDYRLCQAMLLKHKNCLLLVRIYVNNCIIDVIIYTDCKAEYKTEDNPADLVMVSDQSVLDECERI